MKRSPENRPANRVDEAGFGLVEFLVGMTIGLLMLAGAGALFVHQSRVHVKEMRVAETQDNARITLAILVETIRTAGWDPLNTGLGVVTLDADTTDAVSELEVFADLDEDGATISDGERVLIRHSGTRVSWRRTGVVSDPFEIVADNITNDADGDGTPEPMFVPDSTINPTRILVTVTAEAEDPDPISGQPIRRTLSTEVLLRNAI